LPALKKGLTKRNPLLQWLEKWLHLWSQGLVTPPIFAWDKAGVLAFPLNFPASYLPSFFKTS